ncbi:MAG TPA: winged helix-turn-helix domain-containing protein [Rhizomicrobium sp.]|jgi:DNA-binding winged helix-turn-helix (wHTH) protein
MTTSTGAEPALSRKNQPPRRANQRSAAAAEPSLEFGRFRVLLRQRLLLADGVPIELGTRAFEFLLALLEADGSLVSKEDLLARVWPDTIVVEQNLKVQVSALRRALGEDRDFIRTEFGRGYRFTAAVRSTGRIVRRSTSKEYPVSAFPSLQLAQIDLRPHPPAH